MEMMSMHITYGLGPNWPEAESYVYGTDFKQPRHKTGSMASGDNWGQKVYLLALPQYALVPDLRQNVENNRGRKPLLYWCLCGILSILNVRMLI